MQRLSDQLIQQSPWSGLVMGNHALVRAMFESGVQVTTSYPGSPTPEIASAILSVPEKDRPLVFQYATNEKVALEVAFGAAINGHLSCVFFKSVGLNVASDSAIQLSLMNIIGGMVIVLGDDPGANSSQNEQDNRHFARQSYIPMFEPATPEETYGMFLEAAKLARKLQMPILFRMTTHVCHARQMVPFGSLEPKPKDWTPRFDSEANGPYIPITADVFPLKRIALDKLDQVEQHAETTVINQVYSPNGTDPINGRRLGVISASMPAMSVLENLHDSKHSVDLLKLGLSYPMPKAKVLEFLSSHDEVVLVEELDPVMELEIKSLAWDKKVDCKIFSRQSRDYIMGELGPWRTWNILSDAWPDLFEKRAPHIPEKILSPRLPQMCPGCGHRAAFFGVKKSLPDNAITVADIGCHSMGYYPPHKMGEVLMCMGHSNGTAGGMTIGNDTRKVVSFIGDSTFFHAGMPAIINAIVYDYDFTLVVMENGTTAMTGHQPHPGSGELSDKIPILRVLESLGVKFLKKVDAYDQKSLQATMTEAMAHKGFSVVIASHPCMLKFVREKRKKGKFTPLQMEVSQVCDHSYVCLEDFACPSFVRNEDGSVKVNNELCIGDGSCIAVCPVGALKFPEKKE